MDYVNLIDTLSLWLYPSPLPYYPTPNQRKIMVGTLWKCNVNNNEILVCTKHEDGFMHMVYLDNTGCKAVINESTIHTYYIQLTQPQEET